MEIIDLTGSWQFRLYTDSKGVTKDQKHLTRWMKSEVPGTVHTDLMKLGIIPDPYYRMQEYDVQWVDTCAWEYRKEFRLPAEWKNFRTVELIAEGLDTFTTVTLNDTVIAETDNMFIEHRIDIKEYLRKGKNTLSIVFHSPTERAKNLESQYGRLFVDIEPWRVYARKAQYSYGWDWGPKLTTSGIWRSIYIEGRNHARLKDPFVKTIAIDEDHATMECSVAIENKPEETYKLNVTISGDGRITEHSLRFDNDEAAARIEIPKPRLWWPNGWGEAYLYHAVFQLLDREGAVIHTLETDFGIRTVRLLREKDEAGESFIFEINGRKIFSKGANWIPADNFVPRIPDDKYDRLLRLAAEAHLNMIRVWGGGIYEQNIFYDLCDRLGLMVWQDFMFACGEYPEHPEFISGVVIEAVQNIKRLRNHPSIVLWCGNNECEYLFCNKNPGCNPDDMKGAVLFRDVLRKVCEQTDDTRPYWRSSPFGTGHPNDVSNGNHHQWEVWSNWRDYRQYENTRPRFVTEFGFQGPANKATFEEVTIEKDRHFQSKVMEHHNKQVEGTERLFKFQSSHYKMPDDFRTFIHHGQLVQANALKFAVEHWRRSKFVTAGAVYWQLNDCWPVSSWSVIDSSLRPKAAYYYSKRFFAPMLVSFHEAGDTIEVWITNDRPTEIKGQIELTVRTFDNTKHSSENIDIVLPSNGSLCVHTMPRDKFAKFGAENSYIYAGLVTGDMLVSENRFFFDEPKHLILPSAKIDLKIHKADAYSYTLKLRSKVFVKSIVVSIEGIDADLSDNYFDLDPWKPHEVHLTCNKKVRNLKQKISLFNVS
jgi:beta-mannosidase